MSVSCQIDLSVLPIFQNAPVMSLLALRHVHSSVRLCNCGEAGSGPDRVTWRTTRSGTLRAE